MDNYMAAHPVSQAERAIMANVLSRKVFSPRGISCLMSMMSKPAFRRMETPAEREERERSGACNARNAEKEK